MANSVSKSGPWHGNVFPVVGLALRFDSLGVVTHAVLSDPGWLFVTLCSWISRIDLGEMDVGMFVCVVLVFG